ncbi:hypothetical protein [Microcystis phage Mwe-JY26]
MARLHFQGAPTVIEGRTYVEQTEDGSVHRWDYFVGVTIDGVDYVHPKAFRFRQYAETFADKVFSRGSIDRDIWVQQEPEMSLEERWGLYAQREQEVRWGLRSEEDMYHGL